MLFGNKKTKIFCIGFNKTGTTSIEKALKKFGYKMGSQKKGELLLGDWRNRNFDSILKFCKSAEAFQDIPFSLPYTYMALDQKFKNSKFILTERKDAEQWYQSMVSYHSKLWANGDSVPTFEQLKKSKYRYPGFAYDYIKYVFNTPDEDLYNEKILKDSYRSYNESVKKYFETKPKKLIVINVSHPNDFRRLCQFLKVNTSEKNFPWENKTNI